MPVISIKSLPLSKTNANNKTDIPELLKKLNVETAKAIGYEPQHIWSYWQFIEPHHYAVADRTAGEMQHETHSPIINVLSFEGKSEEHIEKMLGAIAKVISDGLDIDIGNVFITYHEVLSGRVFDGGGIVKKK